MRHPRPDVDGLTALLFGTALGDSLGLPFEGLPPRAVARRLGSRPLGHRLIFGRGLLSDDTEHAVLVAQAFLASRGDPARFTAELARRLRWWFACLPPGVGMATAKACLRLWAGVPPARAGVASAGNGPCMRAPLLGALIPSDHEARRRLVDASSRLTHRDARALDAARFIARLAAEATLHGPQALAPAPVRQALDDEAQTPDVRDAVLRAVDDLDTGIPPAEAMRRCGGPSGVSGFVLQTVPAVVVAVLAEPRSPLAAIELCVRAGGDTDSTAALAGAVTGAAAAMPVALPDDLLAGIVDRPLNPDFLRRLAERLAASVAERADPIPLPWMMLPPRNMAMLMIVLAHGFGRLVPRPGSGCVPP